MNGSNDQVSKRGRGLLDEYYLNNSVKINFNGVEIDLNDKKP